MNPSKALLLVMSLTFLLYQEKLAAQIEKKPTRFGFRLGANYAHTNFSRGFMATPAAPLESEWRPGITVGFFMNIPLNDQLRIQPEYLFTVRNSYMPAAGTALQLSYLALPVLLNYRISPKISLLAGPQFDLLIKGKRKEDGMSEDITHDTEERNLGITAGVEYNFVNDFFVEGRYMHGLSNVGLGQRSDVTEFKFQVFELTAGVRF